MNHTKPTQEELKANVDQALKDLEVKEPKVPPETEVKEEPKVEAPPVKAPEPSEPPKEPETPPEPPQEDPQELKKKLSNSAREAQVLQSRTKKYDEAVTQAEGIQEPTEEDMAKEYGPTDWETMSDTEKKLARKSWVNERRFEIMSQVAKEGKDIEKWNSSVDTFVGDPKSLIAHPELEGKTEDFKLFAMKPSRRGLDFEDLVLAFNGDLATKVTAPKKGKMFEIGTPGQNEKPQPKDDTLSPEQARILMNTDYKKYVMLLKAGKIRNI